MKKESLESPEPVTYTPVCGYVACAWMETGRSKVWSSTNIEFEPPPDCPTTVEYQCIYCGGTRTEVEVKDE